MQRLTERDEKGFAHLITRCADGCKYGSIDTCNHECDKDFIEKLAEYEDLEEQGLLLRLPLKIEDTVYAVTRDFISEYTICSIEVYNEGLFFNWKCEKGMYINLRGFTEYNIGKTVFLTREEAEQKLKEMESD